MDPEHPHKKRLGDMYPKFPRYRSRDSQIPGAHWTVWLAELEGPRFSKRLKIEVEN